jgi:hypothetical protein
VSWLQRDFSALRRLGVLGIFWGGKLVAAGASVGVGRQGLDSGGSGFASDFTACPFIYRGGRFIAADTSVGVGRQGLDSGGSGFASDFTACPFIFSYFFRGGTAPAMSRQIRPGASTCLFLLALRPAYF